MSKLLRLPLTLLAVLAAVLFLPGMAWGLPSTPSAAECADNAALEGCTTLPAGDSGTQDPTKDAGLSGQQPTGTSPVVPLEPPADVLAPPGGLDEGTPPPPPDVCTTFPQAPVCAGDTPPTAPLTCDGLAQLLGQSGGCPSSFSCEDLAQLLGLTCPAGPPDCQALADLFHLEGCPATPTSCEDFAALLQVNNCSQIPCLDTSQLPAQARDGLAPLFDGLERLGIKECPARPVPTTPGKGTHMPPTQPAAQQPPPQAQPAAPYYANCTDARAQGVSNIAQGTPGYRPELDADHDGTACDESQTPVARTAQPSGRLAYTGLDLGPQLNVAWTLLMLGSGLLILGRRRA